MQNSSKIECQQKPVTEANQIIKISRSWFDPAITPEDINQQIKMLHAHEYNNACKDKTIRIFNKAKSSVMMDGIYKISNGHTSYINVREKNKRLITRGLSFREISQNNVLKNLILNDFKGKTTELEIPKVINSDISFQLMFGFHYPFEKVNNYIGKDPYHGIPEQLL